MVLRKRIGIFFGICCILAVMVAVMAGIQRKGQEQSALAEKEKRIASSKVSSETSEELYRMLLDEVEKYAGKEVDRVKADWIATYLEDPDINWKKWKREEVSLGNPLVIYNPKEDGNNLMTKYPLIADKEVIGILEACVYQGKWNFSVSDMGDRDEVFAQLVCQHQKPIAYVAGMTECGYLLDIEIPQKVYEDTGWKGKITKSSTIQKFIALSYTEKLKKIIAYVKKCRQSQQKNRR